MTSVNSKALLLLKRGSQLQSHQFRHISVVRHKIIVCVSDIMTFIRVRDFLQSTSSNSWWLAEALEDVGPLTNLLTSSGQEKSALLVK